MTVRRRAVVTGAASGLGRDISIALGRRGFHVLVSDMDMEEADQTRIMVEQAGGTGETFPCDVTRVEEVRLMADHVFSQGHGLDLLVNNAGVAGAGLVGEMPLEDWHWVMGINFWGVVNGCHVFVPRMKDTNRGHIINISSGAGIVCLPDMGAYNTSKAAVISLSETLQAELASCNIGVTVCCPTFFNTNLLGTYRCCSEFEFKFAHSAFEHARITSEDVAELTLRAYEKKRLYVLPQRSARLQWALKRISPEIYHKTFALMSRTSAWNSLALMAARLGLT